MEEEKREKAKARAYSEEMQDADMGPAFLRRMAKYDLGGSLKNPGKQSNEADQGKNPCVGPQDENGAHESDQASDPAR